MQSENRENGYDESPLSEEEIIDDVLGSNSRAADLRTMRGALEARRHAFRKDLESAADDREKAALRTKIAELNKQIRALREEEAISAFVEDSVRVTLHRSATEDMRAEDMERDDDDDGF